MSAIAFPTRGVVTDRRTGLRVWSPEGSKASRASLERTIEAATIRSMPIAEAERLGLRDKAHRFARTLGASPASRTRDASRRVATEEES
jgi:hypothetical protein